MHRPIAVSLRIAVPMRITATLCLLVLTIAWPGHAAADGEATGIIVTPPRVAAGDEIFIQGFALWTELPVTAALVGKTGASRSLGSGLTGPDGTLSMTVAVPGDVPAGQYTVVVRNTYGEEARAPVVIQPELPILPLVAIGGASLVVAVVVVAALRRGSTGSNPPTG
jgi:hypothetical protein